PRRGAHAGEKIKRGGAEEDAEERGEEDFVLRIVSSPELEAPEDEIVFTPRSSASSSAPPRSFRESSRSAKPPRAGNSLPLLPALPAELDVLRDRRAAAGAGDGGRSDHLLAAARAVLARRDAGVAVRAHDADGRRRRARGRTSGAGHHLRHAHADREAGAAEHGAAVAGAAAPGHALARAHHRLAGRELLVVADAADGAQVGRVGVELLQVGRVRLVDVDDEVAEARDHEAVALHVIAEPG